MPPSHQHNAGINAKRFAAFLAGFDTGNASDEEALGKALGLRRMAQERHARIVDLLEEPEVRKAIDHQMQPKRHGTADLQKAVEETEAMRQELLERTRDARELTEALADEKEAAEHLRLQITSMKRNGTHGMASASSGAGPIAPARNGARLFEIAAAGIVVVLLIIAAFTGKFLERSNAHELGSGNGNAQALVRKDRAVHPSAAPHPLPHRLHSGGPRPGTR